MSVMKSFQGVLCLFIIFSSVMFMGITEDDCNMMNRASFPKDFTFGTASAAYQYEGAFNQDGRSPSIWDTYTHKFPERIADRSNGDEAIDQYNRYMEDVALMKDIGMDAYRFSISWSRVLPSGHRSRGVNEEGILFYNNFINELLSKGLQPYVTIFHWDVPQSLEDEYGGFLSSNIVPDFQDYAELCYQKFGDRVKYWITVNEAHSFSNMGYNTRLFAPGRCSKSEGNCSVGDSATEPYIVAHNLLLAHAAAVKLYREKYQADQKGKIGMALVSNWMTPFSEAREDKFAAQRALDFIFGWFMHPITYGTYPKTMRSLVGNRLPRFNREESYMLKGSDDFVGLNYYTTNYAVNHAFSKEDQQSYRTDKHLNLTLVKNGIPIGPLAGSNWLAVYPRGIYDFLIYTKQQYNNPTIYITENGVDEVNNSTLPLEEQLSDNMRIDYHCHHLSFVLRALKEGVDLKGYFAWSLLDNFEWADGYTVRFGINYVDLKTLTRYPKHSSNWFKKFLHPQ